MADRVQADCEAALESIPGLLANEEHLQFRGRFLDCDFIVEAGEVPFHFAVRRGRIAELKRGPLLMRSWTFGLRAHSEAWLEHWQAMPRPGFHDIFAMAKGGHLRVEGELQPLMANLQYVKDVLALPRTRAAEAA